MKIKNKLNMLAYTSFLLALILFVIMCIASNYENVNINSEHLGDFSQGWTVEINDSVQGTHNLPIKMQAKKGELVRITNTLPLQMRQNSTLFFRSSQSFVRVFAGDKLLHSYGYNSQRIFGKSPGSAWQVVRIPVEDFGKKISIELTCPYQKYSGNLNPVFIGTKASIVFYVLHQSLWSCIACILMFLVGVVLMGIYFTARASYKYEGLLHLGVFSMMLSGWSIGESKILQLFSGYPEAIGFFVFTLLILLPIPFLLFLNTLDIFKNDKHIKWLVYFFVINYVTFMLLQAFNIADLFVLVTVFNYELLVGIAIMAVKLVRGIRRGGLGEYKILVVALGVLMLFAIISVVIFQITSALDNSSFMNIGFFAFILLIGFWSIRKTLRIYSLQIEKNTLAALAYTDILTKLPNRTSFEDALSEHEKRGRGALVVMFDLNDLKLINDNYSHKAGDAALVLCSRIIKESFSKVGCCYRIGGDEFCVVGGCDKKVNINAAVEDMRAAINKANNTREIPINIAYGYATFPADAKTAEDALNLADKQMYVCKAQIKSQKK